MAGGTTIDRPGITIDRPKTVIKKLNKQGAPPENDTDDHGGGGTKYRVLLLNDPVNTKEYVARVLMTKAGLSERIAFQVNIEIEL